MKSIRKRPRGTYVITVRITLRDGEDDDLIETLKKVESGNLAKTIKKMMRDGKQKKEDEFEEDEDFDLSGLGKEI